MSLPHALLTALSEKPGSGLDLARRFDRSIGYFWSATHQQIYRELARLETAGLIASEAQPETRGQKRIYRPLPAGLAELRRWISQPEDAPALRDALMVRMRAAAAIGPDGFEEALRHRLTRHHAALAAYREIEARDFATPPETRAKALQHLILTAGIRHETGWIEMLEQALAILSGDDPAQA